MSKKTAYVIDTSLLIYNITGRCLKNGGGKKGAWFPLPLFPHLCRTGAGNYAPPSRLDRASDRGGRVARLAFASMWSAGLIETDMIKNFLCRTSSPDSDGENRRRKKSQGGRFLSEISTSRSGHHVNGECFKETLRRIALNGFFYLDVRMESVLVRPCCSCVGVSFDRLAPLGRIESAPTDPIVSAEFVQESI